MFTVVGYSLLFLISVKISVVDIKTHFIHNLDLIILFLILNLFFEISIENGLLNFLIYLIIYFISRKQLGFGDVKLALILGCSYQSVFTLMCAINISWVMGGVWALLSKQRRIAFAPWMLSGACFAKILVA
jgi:hypothetical protein